MTCKPRLSNATCSTSDAQTQSPVVTPSESNNQFASIGTDVMVSVQKMNLSEKCTHLKKRSKCPVCFVLAQQEEWRKKLQNLLELSDWTNEQSDLVEELSGLLGYSDEDKFWQT